MLLCTRQRGGLAIAEVVCYQSSIMMDQDPLSPEVRVVVTEEEALWYEFGHADSQQGSSSEGNVLTTVLTARALSQDVAGLSRHR